jgi:hypothetical protein
MGTCGCRCAGLSGGLVYVFSKGRIFVFISARATRTHEHTHTHTQAYLNHFALDAVDLQRLVRQYLPASN